MADLTSKRLVDKINRTTTNINVITTGALDLAKVPMYFETDRQAVEIALGMIGLTAPDDARIVRIENTLHLTEMDLSEPLMEEAKKNPQLQQITSPAAMQFDIEGNLAGFRRKG